MNTPTPVFASLQPAHAFEVDVHQHTLRVLLQGRPQLTLTAHRGWDHPVVSTTASVQEPGNERQALMAACEGVFTRFPCVCHVDLETPESAATRSMLADGVLIDNGAGGLRCAAQAFWQVPQPWLCKHSYGVAPQQYVMTANNRHPLRPVPPAGVLYRRFIPWLGKTLTLATADADRDLVAFNRWMNNPRVAHFWEEEGSLEQHHAYLRALLKEPHAQPLIGRFDDEPFGYFEVYWAREDRISPFYPADDFDRGLHLLVGEEAFRGKPYYTAWFSSLCHYLFLDDPRTQRIVCEPRHDNHRQIANFDRSGFARLKHFDFPHKRALLVMLSRERFFGERLYQPLDAAHIIE